MEQSIAISEKRLSDASEDDSQTNFVGATRNQRTGIRKNS